MPAADLGINVQNQLIAGWMTLVLCGFGGRPHWETLLMRQQLQRATS